MEPKSTPESVCPEVPGIGETCPISDGCSLEDAGPAPQSLTFIAGRAVLIPADSCVHQLFETQAARTPDAVAVVFEGEQLSYRALNASANQLAHYLSRMGVGVGTRVGVFLERSPSMLVALLGILKAGAAYVPLDPIYPADRRAYMLEDAGAASSTPPDPLASRKGCRSSTGPSSISCTPCNTNRDWKRETGCWR